MVDYTQTVKKVKIEMPVDDKDNNKVRQEQQTPPVKKEVHILYE